MIETGAPPIPSEPQGGLDARFCEAMDAAPVMIWVSGEDKLCIWFNRPWLEFTGRTLAEELGNGWAEGVHPEDFDRCLEIYVSHFDARTKFRTQYRMRRHDGEYRWIDDIGIPRYARDGSFLGYFGSCTDVHDQKAMEAELRKLKETLEQRAAKEQSIRVSLQFGTSNHLVLVDKVQIQQVLLNLLRNAIEAMQSSVRRELVVSTAPVADDMVAVSVADTGAGIAPDIISSLFQPFVTTKQQGLGIGLSISRTIIESHGGQIMVEPNTGGGTIFCFTLRGATPEEGDDGE